MRMFCCLIVLLSLCLPARAADATKFALNGWIASSFKDSASGRFSHCSAFASFEGGSSLVISVDRNYAWALGFGISSWRFDISKISISYRFDAGPWVDGHGEVQNPKFVTLIPPAKTRLTDLLKHRDVMEAELDGELYYFQLGDSDELLARLASCYRQAAAAPRPAYIRPRPCFH